MDHVSFLRLKQSCWRATSDSAGWKSLWGCGESTRVGVGGQFQMFGAVGEKWAL